MRKKVADETSAEPLTSNGEAPSPKNSRRQKKTPDPRNSPAAPAASDKNILSPDFEYDVAIVGLGYVGLPLGVGFARAGLSVLGYDMDAKKVEAVNAGKSYISHIADADLGIILDKKGRATLEPQDLRQAAAVLICVPTPLTRHREPDMHFIENTAAMLAGVIRPGQLVILESTTYPGTTRELLLPKLESGGLKAGRDFHLAYSPEREDPGSAGHSAPSIPKVVGGLTPACLAAARRLYDRIVPATVPVSSLETAEATKLMENIFRCVNIALVNELKQVFQRMDIDVWEVVEAAKSKPFGFMPFYPGPGLGGHCIPIDPFYLTWKAREFDCSTRFIELAGEVNIAMPEYVVGRAAEELNAREKSLRGSRVLILGMAYKKDVDDIRESPSLKLLELFRKNGAEVAYHDPFIPALKKMRRYDYALCSTPLSPQTLAGFDLVVIATDHSGVDYRAVGEHARLILDTRNAMAKFLPCKARVAKA